jgi:hypothetical protein
MNKQTKKIENVKLKAKKFWFVQTYVGGLETNFRAGWKLDIYKRKKDIPAGCFDEVETHSVGYITAKDEEEAKKKYLKYEKEFWAGINTKFYI